MGTKKLLARQIGKKTIFKELGCWVTQNSSRNIRVSEYFDSNTLHRYADPKFWIPEVKSLLIRVFEP